MTDAELLRAAAEVYERRGSVSEPGRAVPGWLRLLAHEIEAVEVQVTRCWSCGARQDQEHVSWCRTVRERSACP